MTSDERKPYEHILVKDPHTGEEWETTRNNREDLLKLLQDKERPSEHPTFDEEQALKNKYGEDWWSHIRECKSLNRKEQIKVLSMGIATTVLQKNQELWGSIFNAGKNKVFGGKKKAQPKEKPRKWTH